MLRPSFRLYTLELDRPWAIASRMGSTGEGISQREICLLRLEDEDGVAGCGEAAPVQTYGESILSVLGFLRRFDWSRISFDTLEESLAFLHRDSNHASARSAIDIALHDGASKKRRTTIQDMLQIDGGVTPPTCLSIGIGGPESTAQQARAAERFPSLKIKAGPTGLQETLTAIRSARSDTPIRIDGNEAWKTREEALRQIEIAHRFGPIEFVEQAMPRSAPLDDLKWLKDRSPLPLFADESCTAVGDIERCAAGFHGINVKLSKSGGLSPALALIRAAKKRDLRIQLGCMIESSLGIGAALHLASEADWLDLDGALLTGNDPFKGITEKRGQLSFNPDQSPFGIGVRAKASNLWNPPLPSERPITERSIIRFPMSAYGHSAKGVPLEVYLPSSGVCEVLVFASIHGEEPETTALLSKALRSLDRPSPHCAIALCANPDGTLLGTRCNARGVELNRNFPSSNWQVQSVSAKWAPDHGRVEFSPGASPGSEPETQALISLVESLRPQSIIALHAPLACVEDPEYSPLGYRLARASKLPLVGNIGYPTPGSFGSWAKDRGFHVITYELPPVSVSAMHGHHLNCFIDLLRFGISTNVSDAMAL